MNMQTHPQTAQREVLAGVMPVQLEAGTRVVSTVAHPPTYL